MDTKLLYDYHVWSYAAVVDPMENYLPQVLYNEPIQSIFFYGCANASTHLFGTYHRGAIASMLRQLGYSSHSVNFVSYIKTQRERL